MKKTASSSSSILIIALIILAVILLFSSLFGSSGLAGRQTGKLQGYNVEPFSHRIHYATYPENANIDTRQSMMINRRPSENVEPIHGFDGLYGSTQLPDNNVDVFKTAMGSTDPQCFSTASGLSNSRGALCLDNSQMNLLQTRGGNQTGRASVIGGSAV